MPRVQFSHDLDAFTYCPAMHEEHFVRSLLLSSPSGHSVHSTCASAFVASSSLYLPAGQRMQVAAPVSLYLPSGHTVHAPLDFSPLPWEKVPALQFVHTPTTVYVPLGHRLVGIGVGRS